MTVLLALAGVVLALVSMRMAAASSKRTAELVKEWRSLNGL